MTSTDAERLALEASCVGTVTDITGHDCAGWIIVSINRRGRPRWRGQVERKFVTWGVIWRDWRTRSTHDVARVRALAVLGRLDAERGRGEP